MRLQVMFMMTIGAAALFNTCGGSPQPTLKLLLGANSVKKIMRLVNSNSDDATTSSSSSSGGSSSSSSTSLASNPLTAFVQGVRASRQADSSSSTTGSSKSSTSSTSAPETAGNTRIRRGAIDFDLLAMIVRVVLLIIEIEVRIFLKLFGIRLPDFGDDITGFLRQPLQFLESLT